MTHAQEVVAGLLRGTFASPPKMTDAERLKQWNDNAARLVAEDRKANPGAVIVAFTKRRPK